MLDGAKVCATAVRALATIGDPIAAASLAEWFSSTEDRMVRKEAERALCRLNTKDPRGGRAVLESYERSRKWRGRKPRYEWR